MGSFGQFEGDVVAKWLRQSGDDRDMQLLEKFAYGDQHGKRWLAPNGSIVNGASIPSSLWSAVGPPFVGDYRRASVIHDAACVEKSETHEEVHRMFYNAMRADGMGWLKATTMYQAVKRFGPRWNIASGAIEPMQEPSEEEMLEFVSAVERAADELGESASMEEIEARAEKIMAPASGVSSKKKKPKKKTKGKGRTVSKVSSGRKKGSKSGGKTTPEQPAVMVKCPNATKKHFANTMLLREFRREAVDGAGVMTSANAAADAGEGAGTGAGDLSKDERLILVDQALVLFEQSYVHLPLKEAMYAIDPVQKLRLLREKIVQTPSDELPDIKVFHRELATIFHSARDLHSNYFLPEPFSRQIVFLPFLVEDFFDGDETGGQRRFLVTRVFDGFQGVNFEPGVEILRWNGIPIERAVEINGDRYAGSNPEARRARGIETLTTRPLIQSLPPDEDFVIVEYRSLSGAILELRIDWMTFDPDPTDEAGLGEMSSEVAVAQGIDLEQTLVRYAKKLLYAPKVVAQTAKMEKQLAPAKGQGLVSQMPGVLQARNVTTRAGEFGYIRIRTFSVNSADSFVREFVRLVEQLSKDGLIIDVRGNGGGLILAGEQLLQVLTPRPISPTLFQLRNTPLNVALVNKIGFLRDWRPSMRQALTTGATYSAGFPITPVAKANEVGQRYHGPVVLITDGLCYSTTDIFAAGFQDHAVGFILGTDGNTGAGGANVWGHDLLSDLMAGPTSPFHELPSNAGMRISMRRTIRVGLSNGTVLEDLGVEPDDEHLMTRADVLGSNEDLIEAAGSILDEMPMRRIDVEILEEGNDEVELKVVTQGFDRLDIYEVTRPLGSADVTEGENIITVATADASELRFEGFDEDKLVVAFRNS